MKDATTKPEPASVFLRGKIALRVDVFEGFFSLQHKVFKVRWIYIKTLRNAKMQNLLQIASMKLLRWIYGVQIGGESKEGRGKTLTKSVKKCFSLSSVPVWIGKPSPYLPTYLHTHTHTHTHTHIMPLYRLSVW